MRIACRFYWSKFTIQASKKRFGADFVDKIAVH